MAFENHVEVGVQDRVTVTQPLIIRKDNVGEDGGSAETLNTGHPWMVYLSTFVAVCGSFAFGSCVGFSSPAQEAIRNELNLSIAEFSLFGSIVTFGAMVGAIASGPIADYFGRKGALRISSGFCFVGWLAIFFAKGPWPLDIGRLATGFGMGVFSYVVPVFVAEIAPKNLRGALTALNQLMIVLAVSVSFIIGTVIPWRPLALIGIIPCAVVVVGLVLIPESPRWLVKNGRQKEFETSLQKLRGKGVDISAEAIEIQKYIETIELLPQPTFLELFQKRYLRSVMIAVGIHLFQQLGGINGVVFYATNIFESAGFSPKLGSILYAFLQVFVTLINATLVDRAGRKPLLLVSISGLLAGCVLIIVAFYLKAHQLSAAAVPGLAVSGILVYIGSFSIGMGAIPWILMSEIFPINIKGRAGSLATLVNWFGAWLCSYTFNFLMNWSSCGTFIIYAVINVMNMVFVITMVPETKGRTLEQIQAAISGQ